MTMTTTGWTFTPLSAGSTGTKGLQASLMGGHLERTESFVREVTQNAVDARLDGHSVSMEFHTTQLTPSQLKSVRRFLFDDGSLARHARHFPKDKDGRAIVDAIEKAATPGSAIRVLRVDDHGTCGLGGALGGTGAADHFSRLVYFFGQTHDEGSTKGGAFGFGKSVYSNASSFRTVIYYSHPMDTGVSRLIAVSLFPGHTLGDDHYLGFALCGKASGNAHFPTHPVTGSDADEMAAAMGFVPRSDADPGTSVMVLGCDFRAAELRAAMEKWWWPRLYHSKGPDGLTARFFEDGAPLPPPNPNANEELASFVQAYRHLLDLRDEPPDVKIETIKSTGNRVVGKVVLKRIDPPGSDESGEESWHRSSVAMFRGPKLIVQYVTNFGSPRQTPFVGVFVADPGLDGILRRAENPAHTDWDDRSSRLEANEPAFVRAVMTYCRKAVQKFQNSFEAQPPNQSSKMHVLGDMLGRLLSKGTIPGGIPKAPPRPIHLKLSESRVHGTGYDQATIQVSVDEPGVALPAELKVTAEVLGDANRSALEKVEVELFDHDDKPITRGFDMSHPFDVPAQGSIRFTARAKSPPDSPLKFVVKVVGRKP